jgi:hypothetical protein
MILYFFYASRLELNSICSESSFFTLWLAKEVWGVNSVKRPSNLSRKPNPVFARKTPDG